MDKEIKTIDIDFAKSGGLVPAIIQDVETDKVLMLGYMNEESYRKTLESGKVTFWSRSRNTLWTKGETSGNYLYLDSILVDCDHDTLLIKAHPVGPVCHTGTDTCWGEENLSSPLLFLRSLQEVVNQRYKDMPEGSYTTTLFQSGTARMAQKVGEEAVETVIEAMSGNDDRMLYEASDMIYHLIVLLTSKGLSIEDVARELKERHKEGWKKH